MDDVGGMCVIRQLRVLDADYPPVLRELSKPPDPVCIRGQLVAGPRVAIVGTRQPSEVALQYTHTLAYRLARRGAVVWSGGARGIDAAAHQGALDAGGITVAVVGTGLDHCYPKEHRELYDRMVAGGGAVVSPFPTSREVRLPNFPQRNGVLAALTDATVVVQARLKSGARSTANFARRLRRALYVVPGPPWDETYAGNLAEIALGARVLACEEQFFRALGLAAAPDRSAAHAGPMTSPTWTATTAELFPAHALARGALQVDEPDPEFDSAHVRAVFRATCPSPRHFDDLCSETRLGTPLVQQALLTLTLQAVLVEGPAGWYRRASH